jgi:hypothetical protein
VSNDLERRKGVDLARQFHEAHERLAPQFGYETRTETRAFDPESPNGRLMIAVCAEIAERAEADRDDALRMLDRAASYHAALLADREQLRAALAECARVMALDEPRFNEYHDAITDAERLSRVSHKPVVDARAFDQAHGLRDDPITGGIADRPLQIDQTK